MEALSSWRCSIGMLEPQAPARARQACSVPEGGVVAASGLLHGAACFGLDSRGANLRCDPGPPLVSSQALKRR